MTLSRSRRLALTLVAMSALAAALFAGSNAPFGAVAHAAREKACTLDYNKYPKYPVKNDKGGYFTSLRVTNTSCTDGKRQMLAWYKCRIAKGLKGKCRKSRIRKYKCTEKRNAVQVGAGDDVFSARVTCRRGSKKIVHTYDQEV